MSCIDRSGKRTFGTCEGSAFRALEQRFVELSGESGISDASEAVVRLHVFLECLSAKVNKHASAKAWFSGGRDNGGDRVATTRASMRTNLEPPFSFNYN